MALFAGTDLGLLQSPGTRSLQAQQAAQGIGANFARGMQLGMAAREMEREEKEKELLTDATMDILEGLKGAGDFQAKMDVLNSPAAHKMWAHPKGRMIMEGISRNVANEQLVRSRLENTKLAQEQAQYNRDVILIGGATQEMVDAGMDHPGFVQAAKRLAARNAEVLAGNMGIELSDVQLENLPLKANGQLDREVLVSRLRKEAGLVTGAVQLGPTGEVESVRLEQPKAEPGTEFAPTKVIEVMGQYYLQAAGSKELHKLDPNTGQSVPLIPVRGPAGQVLQNIYRDPTTGRILDLRTIMQKQLGEEADITGEAKEPPQAAMPGSAASVLEMFEQWDKSFTK